MKQFNLDEYLQNPSRPVVTRDGRPVRIICTDANREETPVVALVKVKALVMKHFFLFQRGENIMLPLKNQIPTFSSHQ